MPGEVTSMGGILASVRDPVIDPGKSLVVLTRLEVDVGSSVGGIAAPGLEAE